MSSKFKDELSLKAVVRTRCRLTDKHKTNKQTNKHTDKHKQTDRQTDRQTDKQIDRKTDKQIRDNKEKKSSFMH